MKWAQHKSSRRECGSKRRITPREPTAGDTPAHLLPGILHLPVTRLPEGEGQPACRPHRPAWSALHVDSRSGPSASGQGWGGQQVALFKKNQGGTPTSAVRTNSNHSCTRTGTSGSPSQKVFSTREEAGPLEMHVRLSGLELLK